MDKKYVSLLKRIDRAIQEIIKEETSTSDQQASSTKQEFTFEEAFELLKQDKLPLNFNQWDLKDNDGLTVAEAFINNCLK